MIPHSMQLPLTRFILSWWPFIPRFARRRAARMWVQSYRVWASNVKEPMGE